MPRQRPARARTPGRRSPAATRRLTRARLLEGVRFLSRRDLDLAGIAERLGPPPLWSRPQGFATLVRIVLEQQVSLASARAAFDRLAARGGTSPAVFLGLDAAELREIGFSRQKAGYCRDLATAVIEGSLVLDALRALPDAAAREALLAIRGIGPWTADIYLLMALRRPDVWPVGDLALAKAAQSVKGLESTPKPEELESIGRAWRPWRAVAARLLWSHYLAGPA